MGIQIKEPCHEDWSKMTSTEQGAFCQKCAIDVFDFSDKTPIEIKSILKEQLPLSGTTCGKITNIQLNAINNDFYQWKNDQESFRAVWMVSLIAVFGLTLFSCQNTVSKEIISQMESNGTEIIQQEHELAQVKAQTEFEKDTIIESEEAVANSADSFPGTLPLIASPWEWPGPITSSGGPFISIGGTILPINWEGELITCEVTLGSIAYYGNIVPTQEFEKHIEEYNPFEERAVNSPILPKPIHNPPVPYREPQVPLQPEFNGVIDYDGDDFEAYINPNPIKVTSRLYLKLFNSSKVKFSVIDTCKDKIIHMAEKLLVQGKHEIDLGLYQLGSGNYSLVINNGEIEKNIDFEVLES